MNYCRIRWKSRKITLFKFLNTNPEWPIFCTSTWARGRSRRGMWKSCLKKKKNSWKKKSSPSLKRKPSKLLLVGHPPPLFEKAFSRGGIHAGRLFSTCRRLRHVWIKSNRFLSTSLLIKIIHPLRQNLQCFSNFVQLFSFVQFQFCTISILSTILTPIFQFVPFFPILNFVSRVESILKLITVKPKLDLTGLTRLKRLLVYERDMYF